MKTAYRPICGAFICSKEVDDIEHARALAVAYSKTPICEGDVVELERVERLEVPSGAYRSSLMVGAEWLPWTSSDPEERRPAIAFRDGVAVVWPEVMA